jgi:hypothetical protein
MLTKLLNGLKNYVIDLFTICEHPVDLDRNLGLNQETLSLDTLFFLEIETDEANIQYCEKYVKEISDETLDSMPNNQPMSFRPSSPVSFSSVKMMTTPPYTPTGNNGFVPKMPVSCHAASL